jgi:3-deoxy-D-manno-octulosonic-acid transferase
MGLSLKMQLSPWFVIYNLAIIPVFYAGMQIARLFNPKVSIGIRGRKGWSQALSQAKVKLEPGRRFVVIHCASAGEFEAARPLLTALRQRLPRLKAHVTCYSPSGMRSLSQTPEVESYSYLPFDDFRSARRFLRILNPVALIIIKHDVWPNLVWAAARDGIPAFWVNANLHRKTRRLHWWTKSFNVSFLNELTEVLTVSEEHAQRLRKLVNPTRVFVTGDSRYDRTLDRLAQASGSALQGLPEQWLEKHRIIVGGSTWGPDQRLLIPVFSRLKKDWPDLRLVLVPHEPATDFLRDTQKYLEGYGLSWILYSRLNGGISEADVLIVDKVGLLASLYRVAWTAYVGGAFGHGVHSVLEPAVFNLPLFFGPRHHMANEAGALVSAGGAWCIKSAHELETHFRRLLESKEVWHQAAQASGGLVRSRAGATASIVDHLEKLL